MDSRRIADLLQPFLAPQTPSLTAAQLNQISIYIDLLIRWNARVNLTAIRTPDEIVARHFGESLFAARHLLPQPLTAPDALRAPVVPPVVREAPSVPGPTNPNECSPALQNLPPTPTKHPARVVDLGSGAGFPGLPLKIWSPQAPVTLIESNHKKVAFLREVIRALALTGIDVFPGRAEDFPAGSAAIVTLRAVERFATILPTAANLVANRGRLALLVSRSQIPSAQTSVSAFTWTSPTPIPQSDSRVLLISHRTRPEPS